MTSLLIPGLIAIVAIAAPTVAGVLADKDFKESGKNFSIVQFFWIVGIFIYCCGVVVLIPAPEYGIVIMLIGAVVYSIFMLIQRGFI